MAKKKAYDKRVVFDFADLNSKVGQWALYCLPVVAVDIARKYWSGPAFWLTSYRTEVLSDKEYLTPNEEDLGGVFEMLDEAIERSGDMAFCEDLILELQNITAAIQAQQLTCNCGGSGGGCGNGCGGVSVSEGTEQSIQQDVTSYAPPDDRFLPIVNSVRCNRVNGVFAWVVASLEEFDDQSILSLINFGFQFALSVISAVFAPSVIGVWMMQRLGFMSTLGNQLNASCNIEGIVNFLNNNQQEIICAWYSSSTRNEVIAALEDIATREGLPTIDWLLLLSFLTTDLIAMSWYDIVEQDTLNEELNTYSGGVSCATCETPGYWDFSTSQEGWEIVEAGSTNGQWVENEGFKGCVSGAGDGIILIQSTMRLSAKQVALRYAGTLGEVDRLQVQTSDTGEDDFIDVLNVTDQPNADIEATVYDCTDFVDKFVRIRCQRFWSNACSVAISFQILQEGE